MRFAVSALMAMILLGCGGAVIKEKVVDEPQPMVVQDATGLWIIRQIPVLKAAKVKTSKGGNDVTIKIYMSSITERCEPGPPATCVLVPVTGEWEKGIWPYSSNLSGLDLKAAE